MNQPRRHGHGVDTGSQLCRRTAVTQAMEGQTARILAALRSAVNRSVIFDGITGRAPSALSDST
jgi:hypothetical protein